MSVEVKKARGAVKVGIDGHSRTLTVREALDLAEEILEKAGALVHRNVISQTMVAYREGMTEGVSI